MFPAFKTITIHQMQKAGGSELMPDVGACPWKIITGMLSFSKAQKRCSDRHSVEKGIGVKFLLASMGSKIYRCDMLAYCSSVSRPSQPAFLKEWAIKFITVVLQKM